MPLAGTTIEIVPLHVVTTTETSQPFIVLPGPVTGVTTYTPSFVRIQYYATLLTSGSGTATFTSQVSYNAGSSFVANASGAAITLSTTSQSGEQTIQVAPNLATDSGKIMLMIIAVVGGSPTGATCTYRADLLI